VERAAIRGHRRGQNLYQCAACIAAKNKKTASESSGAASRQRKAETSHDLILGETKPYKQLRRLGSVYIRWVHAQRTLVNMSVNPRYSGVYQITLMTSMHNATKPKNKKGKIGASDVCCRRCNSYSIQKRLCAPDTFVQVLGSCSLIP